MRVGDSWRKLACSDLAVLVLWATAGVLLHTVTDGQYGFHSDELATLDDGRSLAWGYVACPPLTPFVALYLNRRLRSQVIHDLNTVNYCT
jgi:hypothetical protein